MKVITADAHVVQLYLSVFFFLFSLNPLHEYYTGLRFPASGVGGGYIVVLQRLHSIECGLGVAL